MKILGLSMGLHDASFAIFENENLIIHEELERINRIKETDADIIEYLKTINISLDDFDYIVTSPHGALDCYSPHYLEYKKLNPNKCIEIGHHLSHIANAFYTSDLEESIGIVVDGGGWEIIQGIPTPISNSSWIIKDNKFSLINYSFDVNIGSLWGKITREIFKLSSGGPPKGCQAGTVMAMSCIGKPNEKVDIFNLPDPETLTQQEKYDYAYALQKYTEDFLKNYINNILNTYPTKNLCISGGVALNCVFNGKIKEFFPDINFIQIPCTPYDAGLAIGSAQFFIHSALNIKRPKNGLYKSPYLGRVYDKEHIEKSLSLYSNIEIKDSNEDEVVDLLIQKNIISVFHGRSESGRRALGNRSILADPRHLEIKDIINNKIKHREWFRPFAPAILREEVSNWFIYDIDSPNMSFAIPFKNDKKELVPAVVHLDGTGRLQTVTEEDNYFFYNLIKKFNIKTNVPILLNTSFNDREPIVETASDAINCFLKTDIDYLYFSETKQLISKK